METNSADDPNTHEVARGSGASPLTATYNANGALARGRLQREHKPACMDSKTVGLPCASFSDFGKPLLYAVR
jgi:hypothetical protein